MANWKERKDTLIDLIQVQKLPYEQIGRMFNCTGSNIKKVARRLGIELVSKRKINKSETFNKGKGKKGICLNCGCEYERGKNTKGKYCSNKCQSLAKHAATFEDRPCEICGRIMHVSKKSTQRFCSIECQHEWQKTRIGPLNKKFTRQAINCEYCGKEFFIKR